MLLGSSISDVKVHVIVHSMNLVLWKCRVSVISLVRYDCLFACSVAQSMLHIRDLIDLLLIMYQYYFLLQNNWQACLSSFCLVLVIFGFSSFRGMV